jgi:hypothetical protein
MDGASSTPSFAIARARCSPPSWSGRMPTFGALPGLSLFFCTDRRRSWPSPGGVSAFRTGCCLPHSPPRPSPPSATRCSSACSLPS